MIETGHHAAPALEAAARVLGAAALVLEALVEAPSGRALVALVLEARACAAHAREVLGKEAPSAAQSRQIATCPVGIPRAADRPALATASDETGPPTRGVVRRDVGAGLAP